MIDELKVFMANPVLYISFPSCEEVVHHSNFVAVHHQFVSQVGTHKTSTSSNLEGENVCDNISNLLLIKYVLIFLNGLLN